MQASEDRLLLKALSDGSRDALRRIYEKYRVEVFTTAVSLLGDIDLAEDCLHDVFVRLAGSAVSFGGVGNLRAYLTSCIVNRARDRIRREVRRACCSTDGPGCSLEGSSGVERLVADEESAALLAAIGRLPCEQREAFVLRAQAGLSFREIAGIQKVSVRTVHSRYRYAVEKLRGLVH